MVDEIAKIPLPGTFEYPHGPNGAPAGRWTVDRFFAGPENGLVEVAVRSVLHERTARFNPLMVCGPPGTGKSHLACGMAEQWRSLFRSRVVCETAKEFARELADAFEVNAVVEFRAKYRECSLFTLEDIEALSSRSAAQVELIHTIDALSARGTQVILTASAPPARLRQLHPTLTSRLGGGLVVTLSLPGVEVRTMLLQQWARLRHIKLSETAAQILAEGMNGPVPELGAAFAELESSTRLEGTAIDAEAARSYVRRRNAAREPPLSAIAARTARYFSLRLADLRGASRRRAVVTARNVAMYLARSLTSHSLEQIGRYFGRRDHTTVLHGCRKAGTLLKIDPVVQEAVRHLGGKWRGAG